VGPFAGNLVPLRMSIFLVAAGCVMGMYVFIDLCLQGMGLRGTSAVDLVVDSLGSRLCACLRLCLHLASCIPTIGPEQGNLCMCDSIAMSMGGSGRIADSWWIS